MIRVTKPAIAPAHLSRGTAKTATDCAAFDAEALLYIDGLASFDFDESIYKHDSVKTALKTAQFDKCCYCEDKIRPAAPGDVEHFRPKKAVRQDNGYPPEPPGYYWLVYVWSNLYLSCQRCNRSAKRTFFPLSNSTKRARMHSEDIADETPLLLDPSGPDDPRAHIHFHNEVPVGVSAKGRQTIKTLQLDLTALNDERRVELNHLRQLKNVVDILEPRELSVGFSAAEAKVLNDARAYLVNAVKPNAIFSAMAQDFLP